MARGRMRATMLRGVVGGAGVRADLRRIGTLTVASLVGQMNETFDGGELAKRLSGHRGTVVLDLAQVSRISSFGVREWLEMVRLLSVDRLVLARCSEAVIHQISMVRSFKGGGSIASFLAPYVCTDCGTEFSALYEVAQDRKLIEDRAPVPVPCPRCGAPGRFDDDPDQYFDVDQHLVDIVDEDLDEVLSELPGLGAEGDPIQKTVEGRDTWVTFNTRIDERLRLHRVLEGLEGTVVFDLTAAMGITREGISRFVHGLQALGPEVLRTRLVGTTPELVSALLAEPALDPRIRIASVRVDAICSDPPSVRKITVNLAAPAIADGLRRGLAPSIPCDWCSGQLDYADVLTLLQRAAELAPEPLDLTPMGAARRASLETMPLPARHSRTPMSGGAGRATPAGVLPQRFDQTPAGADLSTQLLDRPQSEAGASPAATVGVASWIVVAAVAIGGLIGAGGLVGGLLLALMLRPAAPPPQVVAAAAQEVADPEGSRWEGGVPPSWITHVWAEGPEMVEIVGTASAGDPEEGLALARLSMMRTLLGRMQQSMRIPGLESSQPAEDLTAEELDLAIARYNERVGLFATPERAEVAIRDDGDSRFVAARYTLGREAWEKARTTLGETHSFKGMTVARVFPTVTSANDGDAVVVVDAAIWLRAVEVGDVILEVDGKPVESLEGYAKTLARAWQGTPRGEWMPIRVLRGGSERTVQFRR